MGASLSAAQRSHCAIGALPGPAELRRTVGIEKAAQRLLLGGVMPLWLGAGLADWNLHRRTRIEETAGPQESLIHHLMFAETGVSVLLGLFCEVNAGVLAAAYAAAGVTAPPLSRWTSPPNPRPRRSSDDNRRPQPA